MAVRKIISGGQTGGDRGGLVAGRLLGLETGGTAPRGWRTDVGPDPSLAEFGLREHASTAYPPRTEANVREADGTVGFGRMDSPGMRLTRRLCAYWQKPFLANPTASDLARWVEQKGIQVLNVAGNRERSNPGICEMVARVLVEALGGHDGA